MYPKHKKMVDSANINKKKQKKIKKNKKVCRANIYFNIKILM